MKKGKKSWPKKKKFGKFANHWCFAWFFFTVWRQIQDVPKLSFMAWWSKGLSMAFSHNGHMEKDIFRGSEPLNTSCWGKIGQLLVSNKNSRENLLFLCPFSWVHQSSRWGDWWGVAEHVHSYRVCHAFSTASLVLHCILLWFGQRRYGCAWTVRAGCAFSVQVAIMNSLLSWLLDMISAFFMCFWITGPCDSKKKSILSKGNPGTGCRKNNAATTLLINRICRIYSKMLHYFAKFTVQGSTYLLRSSPFEWLLLPGTCA